MGTFSNDRGVFTLIADKGDTLEYSSIGFRKKRFVIPHELSSNRYSVIQLMTQDTFYLPNTIIRPSLSKEEFDKAFTTWHIPDDKYETARKNTEFQTMRMLAFTLPKDGRENPGDVSTDAGQTKLLGGSTTTYDHLQPFGVV